MRIMSSIRLPLFALVLLAMSAAASRKSAYRSSFAPPALPVYEQPLCPGEGYLWTPGYWAYDNDYGDYYWVPGTWVMAPEVACSGLQPTGVGAARTTSSMKATGARRLVSMAGSDMAMDILVRAIKVDAGSTDSSITTVRLTT